MAYLIGTLLVLVGLVGAREEQFQHQLFASQPGIYFEELGQAALSTNDWKLVLHYNLSDYWGEWANIQDTVHHLAHWCQQNNNTDQMIRNCDSLLQPIMILIDGVRKRNMLLQISTPQRMSKRAPFEFMGTLMSDLFGVLDQRDAERYHEQIEDLANGNLHLQQLIAQQTQVLDVTTNILKKEKQHMDAQYTALRLDISSILLHEEFVDAVLQLTVSLMTFKDMQEALVDILTDVHHGRSNTDIISPAQLDQHLQSLKKLLPPTTRLPPYQQHWYQLYHLCSIKAGIVSDQVIFEFKIPLLQTTQFRVFSMLPVPTPHGDEFIYIEPQAPHALVDVQRNWYYPMSSSELGTCKSWDDQTIICQQRQPLYNMHGTNLPCEMALLIREGHAPENCTVKAILPTIYLTPLQAANRWILVLPAPTIFDLICPSSLQPSIRPITLNGSGIVTLSPGCSLRTASMMLNSHTSYVSTARVSVLPHFNLSQHVHAKEIPIISANFDPDLELLDSAVAKLHDASWHRMNVHDISQYALSSILIVVVLCLGLAWWRRRALGRLLFNLQEQPARQSQLPTYCRTARMRQRSL